MNNNRRHLIYLLILILASVFLFSCGQPTFKTLNNISISKSNYGDRIIMYFNGNDPDLTAVKDGPGLFIGYIVSDLPTISNTSTIISDFSKKYGNSSSLGLNVVRPEAGKSILDGVEFYSFSLENSQVSAWKYHYDLDGYYSILNRLNFTVEDKSIKVLDEYNDMTFTLNNSEGKKFEDSDYVHIFAAFSCQSTSNNNFSNLYWSDLTYLGSLQINNQ